MSGRGAEFSDLNPRDDRGTYTLGIDNLATSARTPDINNATIQQWTPNNVFRLGQQIMFRLGVFNEEFGGSYCSRLRLKPWWAWPNQEYRQAGALNGDQQAPEAYLPIDQQVYAGTTLANNRYIWMPSPSRFQVTPFDPGPTPPPAPALNNDGVMLDDIWTLDLQNPADAAYSAPFQDGQVPSRWVTFMYPAMGYALGFTWEGEFTGVETTVNISLSWTIGTLGGSNYQESIG